MIFDVTCISSKDVNYYTIIPSASASFIICHSWPTFQLFHTGDGWLQMIPVLHEDATGQTLSKPREWWLFALLGVSTPASKAHIFVGEFLSNSFLSVQISVTSILPFPQFPRLKWTHPTLAFPAWCWNVFTLPGLRQSLERSHVWSRCKTWKRSSPKVQSNTQQHGPVPPEPWSMNTMLDPKEDHLVDHPSRIRRCTLQGQDDAALLVPTWFIWHMMERSSMRGRVRSLRWIVMTCTARSQSSQIAICLPTSAPRMNGAG